MKSTRSKAHPIDILRGEHKPIKGQTHPSSSWELWFVLISIVMGKIEVLHKNNKNYDIKNYFSVKKQKILPQFDDLTS